MRRLAPLLAAALIHGACVHTDTVDDGLTAAVREQRLAAINRWEMRGRLAIDTGDRSHAARFRWRQDGDELDLTVNGPLGAGSFRVRGNTSSLTVQADGETRVLVDPERELSALVGWWLPVTSLPHWLLGRPDHGFPAQSERRPTGALASLEQRDWQLSYDEYQLGAAGLLIPRRLTLEHAPLELAVNITDWEPLPASEP